MLCYTRAVGTVGKVEMKQLLKQQQKTRTLKLEIVLIFPSMLRSRSQDLFYREEVVNLILFSNENIKIQYDRYVSLCILLCEVALI